MKRLVLTVFLLSIAADARAATITYSTNFSAVTVDGELLQGSTTSFTLPRFDPTLGTLEGVEISFATQYYASLYVGATDDVPSGTFIPVPPFIINGHNDTGASATASGSLRIQLNDPVGASRTLNVPALFADCYQAVGYVSALCDDEDSSASLYNGLLGPLAIPLVGFVGNDPLDLSVLLTFDLLGASCDSDDGGDACLFVRHLSWSGTVFVKYTYAGLTDPGTPPTSAPEPTTLVLLAAGLMTAGLRRTRRR